MEFLPDGGHGVPSDSGERCNDDIAGTTHRPSKAALAAIKVDRERFGNWAPSPIAPMCCARWSSDLSDEVCVPKTQVRTYLWCSPPTRRMRRNASDPQNRTRYGGILVQGTMCPRLIVITA